MLVWLLPEACKRHFAETLCLGVGEDGEDLVRLGRMGKRDAGIFEGMRDLVRVGDGRPADALIEPILEEGLELDAEQTSLGKAGSLLLHEREEVGDKLRLREDKRLAEERTALRAADKEGIGEMCGVFERVIVFRCSKGIGKACAVAVDLEMAGICGRTQRLELCLRIDEAILVWLGDVYECRLDHVVTVAILLPEPHEFVDIPSCKLAVVTGDCEHLVAACFDSAGLMHGDVSRGGADDALPGSRQGRDRDLVRLRATDEEEDLGGGRLAGTLYELLRMEAVLVESIACALLMVRCHETVHDLIGTAFEIIGREIELLLCGLRCFPLMGALCIDRVAGGLEGFPELVLLGGMPVVDGAPGVHRRPQLLRAVAPVGCAYEFLELADERFLLCDVSLAQRIRLHFRLCAGFCLCLVCLLRIRHAFLCRGLGRLGVAFLIQSHGHSLGERRVEVMCGCSSHKPKDYHVWLQIFTTSPALDSWIL